MTTMRLGNDARETLRHRARIFLATAVADPARYELLFSGRCPISRPHRDTADVP
jgi:hypothetical protein